MHGVVECTSDISDKDSKKCLDVGTNELLDHSYRMRGARVIYGSCYVRFELCRFY